MDDKTEIREAQPKPSYEAPVVVKLGDLGSGKGQQRLCEVGTAALGNCSPGSAPGVDCIAGAALQ